MALRIDRKLGDRACAMRNAPTEPEKRLWRHLCHSQLSGFKCRRHAGIVPYVVDFLGPAKALVVEVDGDTHDVDSDRARDARLRESGYHVIHVTNGDVMRNMKGVLAAVPSIASALPDRWMASSSC